MAPNRQLEHIQQLNKYSKYSHGISQGIPMMQKVLQLFTANGICSIVLGDIE